MKLSVVLICRQQRWNLSRLVESVLEECRMVELPFEVVLVDSASTDGTLEAAAKYPIRRIALCPDQRLTASAARYVGFNNTNGEYVLFLDGDMELISGWLAAAIEKLEQNEDIAAVTGKRIDLLPSANSEQKAVLQLEKPIEAGPDDIEVRQCGGAAVYRRSAMDEVGSFNPGLFSDEEPELCIRLRYGGGYRILRLDMTHVYHYTEPLEEFSTLVGRARRNLYVGSGQAIRQLWGSPMLKHYLLERGFAFVPGLAVMIGIVGLVLVATGAGVALLAWWTVIVVGAVLLDAIRKQSLRHALLSVLSRFLHMIGIIRGLSLGSTEAPVFREVSKPAIGK